GRYSLCLALSFLPKEYEHFGQEAFNRYAAEIGEPAVIDGRGFTHGSGYEWEHVFAKAFEGDPDSGRIEYDCEAGGFFCYSDSLSLLENFGARFRAVCMDGEKFAQLVSTALKEASEKEEQETEREMWTEKTGDAPREYRPEKSADNAGIMASRQTGLRILYEDRERPAKRAWLVFPLAGDAAERQVFFLTEGHQGGMGAVCRIAAVDSPVRNLKNYLTADMSFDKLSELAEKIRGMDSGDCAKFSGILDCQSISGIEDVLQAAGNLELYEYIPDVTCSRELGGYLVQNGYLECPEHIRPYLDYHGIGEEYLAEHDCVFTEGGFIVRLEDCGGTEAVPSQAMRM
ncbi:MAG: immunity 51 family protein, partial [Lachnospiraceae bacterium]|nr:immunity 51 family protein [Lachnospiraceae bacterium]